jgi:putative nucleotidyltransferase with HDIG domain
VSAPAARLVSSFDAPDSELLALVAMVDEAQRLERQSQYAAARELYEVALRHRGLASAQAVATPAALLRWIARTLHSEGNGDAALDVLDVSRHVAARSADVVAVGHADNLHGSIAFHQGALDEAERLWRQARVSGERAGEARLAAMASANLGIVANIRGDLVVALHHYQAALVDYRSLGMERDVCAALNNLGMLHADLQQWEAAARRYEEAQGIAEALGDLELRVKLAANVAEMCVARGDFEAARAACDRARDVLSTVPGAAAACDVEKVSGVVARERGEYESAGEHFARAAALAEARKDLLLAAETARERAELYRRQGRNAQMLRCLNEAHALFGQLRARRDLADVDRRTARLEDEFLEVVRRWGTSIESKDRYTQGHCERVADVACRLAERVGLDARSLFWFRVGALLHDVGKLDIPAEVLNKPGKLTEDEWAMMRGHPEAGIALLSEIEFPWDIRPIVLSHHERWDGKGYPHRLSGEAIPFTARILTIADVYDALTSARSYKPALAHAEAMRIMRGDAGTQFDPVLFAAFEVLFPADMVAPPPPRLIA